ncbi:DUF11 domain-containing protein [Nocardioides hwasunensis]|uniref:DUF11 domain-containing protein n=1 Tax=Nocardioides hwasunensis TaxID=397258 RepID=A0ABR8MEE0_9ACTN|nr:DUF11 domain-containing protein [Nocardioides hwasunensis]MBD3913591.1 DUF11 domain-containing protein [Nocardioides hwasunensis]
MSRPADARKRTFALVVRLLVTAVVSGLLAVAPTSAHALSSAAAGPPQLGVTLVVDDDSVEGGQAVQHTIGLTSAGGSTAEGARIWSVLPSGITCAAITAASDGGACASGRIAWSGVDVATGATRTLTYTLTVPDGVSPGVAYAGVVGVVDYSYTADDGSTIRLVPDNAQVTDPTLPVANAPAAEATVVIRTPAAAVVMTRTTSVTESGNAAGQATIGEVVTYTVVTTIPRNTTVYGARVTDPLGSRQQLVPGSLCVNGCTLDGAAFGGVAQSPADTVVATLPTPYRPTSADGVLVLTFQATVLDVAANVRGSSLTNTATVSYADQDGSPRTRAGAVGTTVVEPRTAAAMTHAGSATVTPGQAKAFTVTASNSSATNVSTAHDVTLAASLPAGIEPVTINDGGAWNAAARTITWTVASLAPGASTARTYTVQVESPAVGGITYTSSLAMTSRSLPGVPGARTGASSSSTAVDYSASASDVLRVVLLSVVHDVDRPTATVGSAVTWRVGVEVPAGVRSLDTTVVGSVPDGLAVEGYGAVTCTAGCPGTDPEVITFAPTASGSAQQAAWFLGDLAPAAQKRTYELVLRGHVLSSRRAGGTVTAPASFTSTVRVRTNRADTLPAAPASVPATYADTVGPASATTAVREPAVALDKSVDRGPYVEAGDLVTYSVTIENTATWPAYDVEVVDVPDAELVDVTLVDGASRSTDGWTADDPDLRWLVPGPLAAGASQTFTYTARLAPGATLTSGDQVSNTARVASYSGASTAERADAPTNPWRGYTGPSDTVTVTVAKPQLTLTHTPDDAAATAGSDATFTLTVTNTDTRATAHGVVVRDVLPDGLSYVSSSPSATVSDRTVQWGVGTLAPGASSTVTLVVRVGSDVESGTTLTATASTHADEVPTGTTDAGSLVVGTATDVSVAKTASRRSVLAGEEIVYTLTTTNAGPSDARVTVLTDTLPSYLTFVELDDPDRCGVDGQTITCAYGTLAPGAVREVEVTVLVAAARTGSVTNAADVATTTPDSVPANNHSQVTTPVAAPAPFTTGPVAAISGEAVLGGTLTATPTGLDATTPSAQSFSYAWAADGAEIDGATGTTLALSPALVGARITVTVTARRFGYVDAASTSAATAPVARATFATGPSAAISGEAVFGATLSATPGPSQTGSTSPTADSLTYQWLADGTPIEGATGPTLAMTSSLVGREITVAVTAHRVAYVDAVGVSAPTAPVAKAAFTAGPTASVSGTAQVGQTLTADAGVPAPSPEHYAFAWRADGAAIAGATGSTLTLTSAQRGQRISVTVTASRTGYADVTSTSAPTAPVSTDQAPGLELSLAVPKKARGGETPDGEATALRGRRVTLSWSATDAQELTATGPLKAALVRRYGDQPVPVTGSVRVRLDRSGTHTFRLRATNEAGATSAAATIVAVRRPTVLKVTAPSSARRGESIMVLAAGLGSRERFYVTIQGDTTTTRLYAGRATSRGTFIRTLKLPKTLGRGFHLIEVTGRATHRSGTAGIGLR